MSEPDIDESKMVGNQNSNPVIIKKHDFGGIEKNALNKKWQLTVDFIMIVGKYLKWNKDYINLMKVTPRYNELVSMYKFNPISDITLFENIQTQHFYNKCDLKKRKKGLFRYIHWYKSDYEKIKTMKPNEIFKRIELNQKLDEKRNWSAPYDYQSPIEIENNLCIVPEGITSLGNKCFYHVKKFTDIKLPSTLREINDFAFCSTRITSITIPDSVTKIGSSCFYECSDLTSIKLPETLEKIEDFAFNYNSIISIDIPESLTMLSSNCFNCIKTLTSINFPERVRYKKLKGLTDNVNLITMIKLPEGLTKISNCFSQSYGLRNVIFPSTLKVIGRNCFTSTIANITIPEGITRIGRNAFSYCRLNHLDLPRSLIKIGEGAFNNSFITEITIPENVTHIGDSCFSGCTQLTKITILTPHVNQLDSNCFPIGTFNKIYIEDGIEYIKNID